MFVVTHHDHETGDQFINGPFSSAEAAIIWANAAAKDAVEQNGYGEAIQYDNEVSVVDKIDEEIHSYEVVELIPPTT